MASEAVRSPTVIRPESSPRLPRHVKLKHDKVRGRWLILAPERVLVPDEIAVQVLSRVDGRRSVMAIAEDLAGVYAAPVSEILGDCVTLLQELADKGFVTVMENANG
jgi:pyrroloquinoline quinone biosynthesis protein D